MLASGKAFTVDFAGDGLITFALGEGIASTLVGADGQPRRELFVADMLHLNADGYAVWRPLVAPFLE